MSNEPEIQRWTAKRKAEFVRKALNIPITLQQKPLRSHHILM